MGARGTTRGIRVPRARLLKEDKKAEKARRNITANQARDLLLDSPQHILENVRESIWYAANEGKNELYWGHENKDILEKLIVPLQNDGFTVTLNISQNAYSRENHIIIKW